jgi:O-antigen ligase
MAALAIGTWIFYTPMFQARFFYRGSGTLADVLRGDFDTSGRFEAWPVLWEEAFKRPLLGSGVGSSMVFLESGQSGLTMTHPHNDYLRIAFEVGFIGLACFVVVLVWQVFELSRRIRNSSGLVRNTFAMALMGWFVFAIMALTDNIIIYTVHYMVPLFALMGAAYGVAQNSSEPTASQAE